MMHQEIEFFREKLLPESNIAWETPIAHHIIPQTPTFTSFGDSCLEGAGGYCISLGFWKKHVRNLFWGNGTENMARRVLSRQL